VSECRHVGVYMRMCTKMYIVYNWYYTVGQQSATFVKVFVIDKSTIKLKIRNLRKLICTWNVIDDMKELWVKGLKLWVM